MLSSIATEYLETKREIDRFFGDDTFDDYVFDLNRQLSGMHEQMCNLTGVPHDGIMGGEELARAILRGKYASSK